MFTVKVIPPTKQVITKALPEGRDYSLELPGRKPCLLLWTKTDKPHLDCETDPADATHEVMANTVGITELAALALACLDELHRAAYFTNDVNGPPPVQCAAEVRAYISRQLVIAHNQAAANEADKAANAPPIAATKEELEALGQAETDNQDWYLTSDEAPF